MEENCIFCKIVKGEIPSHTVYEDDYVRAIMDISPASEGHVIIISKEHAKNILSLSDETASKIMVVAKKIATALKEELDCDGINVLQNNGEEAGQTVFHFHTHVVPRYVGDTVNIKWKMNKYKDNELADLAKNISDRIG